jgi:ribonuclease HII
MRRAIARLGGHDHVLVDGLRIADFEAQVGPYTAIVDGDARVYSIACASVVAKVVRDRMMRNLARRYPEYGWDRNAGYATREHRDAIRAHGLTPHHRKSWQALQVLMAGDQLGLFDADEAVVGELGDDLSGVDLAEASMFAVPMGDVEAAEEVAAGR